MHTEGRRRGHSDHEMHDLRNELIFSWWAKFSRTRCGKTLRAVDRHHPDASCSTGKHYLGAKHHAVQAWRTAPFRE